MQPWLQHESSLYSETMVTQSDQEWVLLSYRIPREPSTPRIAIWRKLKELGVAQVGDGFVALPREPRTKERLEWIAAQTIEVGGEAIVWVASPASRRTTQDLAAGMSEARALEYQALLDETKVAGEISARTVQRWRRQFRKIERRDYFGAPGRDAARQAIADSQQRLDVGATTS